ncbi:hypothetical protein [Rummeliibacillus pycnus]|uniref:hypothetical protein n=1 Tax=Rummeliibacillus pycnus TaxID=101070 RepID=UPI0037CA7925
MIYRNMEALKLSASLKVVKMGDTASDIKEAVNAGVWAMGVVIASSEMGLSLDEFHDLSEEDQAKVISQTEESFLQNAADFTIKSMIELPQLIKKINHLISERKRPYDK